jgi:RNA polymerase sigma-70 factor (ECF subfamily)
MVEVEGYTYSETAKLLGIPPGTVRSRISRGRGLLQRALWNQGVAAGLVTPGDGMAERGERS